MKNSIQKLHKRGTSIGNHVSNNLSDSGVVKQFSASAAVADSNWLAGFEA
jgi:hypothetical protein